MNIKELNDQELRILSAQAREESERRKAVRLNLQDLRSTIQSLKRHGVSTEELIKEVKESTSP